MQGNSPAAQCAKVRDVAVEDVMVPRADIRAVEVTTTIADVAKIMSESDIRGYRFLEANLMMLLVWFTSKTCWPAGDDDQGTGRRSCASRYSLHRLCQYLNCSSKCGAAATHGDGRR